jgi:hypothetical protein
LLLDGKLPYMICLLELATMFWENRPFLENLIILTNFYAL